MKPAVQPKDDYTTHLTLVVDNGKKLDAEQNARQDARQLFEATQKKSFAKLLETTAVQSGDPRIAHAMAEIAQLGREANELAAASAKPGLAIVPNNPAPATPTPRNQLGGRGRKGPAPQ